jgi:phosphatidylethanolamine/phosphatidyl-N-methylethanolamine N-methyltransferase
VSSHDRDVWERLAPRYDRVVPWFSSRYDAVRQRLRRDLAGVSEALEVGAGTGQFTLDIAAAVPRVIATDISPCMAAQLRERVRAARCDHVEVRETGADALAVDDAAVDAIVCANVLHVMERPEAALAEFARVLRPGGLLLAPTFCHGQGPVARVLSRGLSLVSPFVAHTRFSAGSLQAFVERHGFAVEEVENLGGVLPLVYVRARKSGGTGRPAPRCQP